MPFGRWRAVALLSHTDAMILKRSSGSQGFGTQASQGTDDPDSTQKNGARLAAINDAMLVEKSVEFILSQSRSGTLSALLMAAVLGAIFVPAVGWQPYLIWFGVVAFGFTTRQFYFLQLFKREGATAKSLRTIAIISAISGWVASTCVPLFAGALTNEDLAVVTALMTSWVAVAVAVLSVQPRIYTAYMLACLFTIYLGWAPRATGAELIALTVGLMLGGLVLHRLSRQIWGMLRDTVQVGAQNKLLADQMADALGSARDAYASRSRFLAAASHDLLQPVHSIKLLASVLQRTNDAERRATVTEQITQSAGSLDSMFRSILDLAQIDAGTMLAKPQALQLSVILSRATAGFQDRCAAKGLGYALQYEHDVGVWVDPVLMGRVIRNLLENALKFTTTGGIRVAGQQVQDHMELLIEDTGVGISEADRPFIFEAFFRGAAAKHTDADGVGLGLAITRHMTDLMKVGLQLAPRAGGQGTQVKLTIPLSQTAPLIRVSTALTLDLKDRFIVLIEDDEKVRKATDIWLRELGAKCLSASNGDILLEALKRVDQAPELIVADYRLGKHDNGLAVIARLRERFGPIPAVLISGDKVSAEELGSVPILSKPVQFDELNSVLMQLLRTSKPEKSG